MLFEFEKFHHDSQQGGEHLFKLENSLNFKYQRFMSLGCKDVRLKSHSRQSETLQIRLKENGLKIAVVNR